MKAFFTFKNERFITQITNGSEVSALARLTLDENLLTGEERSDRCPHYRVSVLSGLNLEKMYGPSLRIKTTV